MKKSAVVMFVVSAVSLLGAMVVLAQGVEAEVPDLNLDPYYAYPDPGERAWDGVNSQDAGVGYGGSFGGGEQYLHINATEFTPLDSPVCGINYFSFHSYSLEGTCTNPFSMAQVDLPAGAWLDRLTCFTYDTDPIENTGWSLQEVDYTFPNGPITYSDIASATEDNTGGWSEVWTHTDTIIRYRDPSNAQFYYLRIDLDPGNTAIRFAGCRLYWWRQISPAPASATFLDVSTGHWAFREIEALADSGITVGCGGGDFCPNGQVTRAEMAVFLARALGLHWPY